MKLRHTQSPQPPLLCRSAISQHSVWDVAQACSQWHLRILLIQLEQKKCSGNTLEQAEETKGKMQQAGLDVVLLLPAPALWAAADLLHLPDASFSPAGQKERDWEAMDSWWKRCEISLICCPRVHLRTGSFCEQEEVLAQVRKDSSGFRLCYMSSTLSYFYYTYVGRGNPLSNMAIVH